MRILNSDVFNPPTPFFRALFETLKASNLKGRVDIARIRSVCVTRILLQVYDIAGYFQSLLSKAIILVSEDKSLYIYGPKWGG